MAYIPDIEFHIGPISNFIIGITQQCNFRCRYCCYSGDYRAMRRHSDKSMSAATLDAVCRFVAGNAPAVDQVCVSFFGGEALLEAGLIESAARRLTDALGERVEFDISTNGWLLTDGMVDRILKIPRAAVSVSLDGIEAVHDRSRLHRSGEPTYRRIVGNLKRFKSRYPDEYHERIRLLLTIGSIADMRAIDKDFDGLKELFGARKPLISHILPNFDKGLTYRDSLAEKEAFIAEAIDFRHRGITNLHTMLLDELLRKAVPRFDTSGDTGHIRLHTCANRLSSCFIDTDGRLYMCEKLGRDFPIGDIYRGFDKALMSRLNIKYALRRNVICRRCDYITRCGRCPTDMNMTVSQHREMCSDYIENIQLAKRLHETLSQ